MKLRISILSMLILLIVPMAIAEDKLFVGGMNLELGMPKDYVLDALKVNYNLREESEDSWYLMTKDGPPYDIHGVVGFKNNQLNSITKDWGSFNEDSAVKFAEEFYSVLSKMQYYSQCPIILNINVPVNEPGLKVNEISCISGNREIKILMLNGRVQGKGVSMQETISKR